MMIKKVATFATFFAVMTAFSQKTHTVVKGDTPYSISKKYGITLDQLYANNPSIKNGVLTLGDALSVGSKKSSSPVKSTGSTTGTIILQPKQTIYGITKQYHISEADLRQLNPDLDAHMKIGEAIVLPSANIEKYGGILAANNSTKPIETHIKPLETPVSDTPKPVENTASGTTDLEDDYVTYTVQNGDTVFGILNKFQISLDELLSLNPSLENGLKAGMVLKIKKLDSAYIKTSGDALSVVLMLPFGFDTNDSRYRTMSLDFLAGAKLAIEKNTAKGLKMDIKVVDAGNETHFKNALIQINPKNTDLIIGPFFKTNIVEVLDYVKNDKIPVVAPFANSEDLYNYSNLIIVETNEKAYADRIVKEVQGVFSDQKIFILADPSKEYANYLKEGLQKVLKNPEITIVDAASKIQPAQNLMTGQASPIIAISANDDAEIGNAFGNRLIEISQEAPGTKAFSMHFAPIFEKKIDELGQVNLVYLIDRKINADGAFEREILKDFKQKYCKDPGKYNVIGFDVVNDILSRENKKGEIFKQMSKSQTQLATKFEYERVKNNGAFINTGYRVVRLIP